MGESDGQLLAGIVDAHHLDTQRQASQQQDQPGYAEEEQRPMLGDQTQDGVDLTHTVQDRVAFHGQLVVDVDRDFDDLPASRLGLKLRRWFDRETATAEAHLLECASRKRAEATFGIAQA